MIPLIQIQHKPKNKNYQSKYQFLFLSVIIMKKTMINIVLFSYRNVKQDNRFVFLCAYENAEAFLSVELQIFFSSAERRIA
ncbi:unnamed protein product [Rotaria socialis]